MTATWHTPRVLTSPGVLSAYVTLASVAPEKLDTALTSTSAPRSSISAVLTRFARILWVVLCASVGQALLGMEQSARI